MTEQRNRAMIEQPRRLRIPGQAIKTRTIAHLLIDMTGSMAPLQEITLSAYNQYIQGLKNNADTVDFMVSVSVFNSDIGLKNLIAYQPVAQAPLLTPELYKPNGGTPLFDAIGGVIQSVESAKKKSDTALVVIQTDGEENASRNFTKTQIVRMVQQKQEAGWQFVYLGCGLDAMAAGAGIGISAGNTLSYAGSQSFAAMDSLAESTVRYARSGSLQTANFINPQDRKKWARRS